ncbi:MAG: beta-galactosidase [Clostridia bacterium]|nr:beta-galactosidase [Clostridia bacterium]
MFSFDHLVHGGDYNPDQWIKTPEVWDEDMRLMKLAHINSATISIFSWALLEPEEGVYNFEWLDTIMDKLHENGIGAILATPSGARPAWLAQKYPEVLRVEENGIRNEFGVRHNHCLTSPIYREKVQNINRMLAERYKNHPALKMWHISNEYSGACHCELCRQAFVEWLKTYYHNSLDELNDAWWSGFWSHQITDWNQLSSPKERGESHVSAMKLSWRRFVSDSHISFLENEIAPLREITPDIPITTNFMRTYDGINYQEMAKHIDVVSWDNYPYWAVGKDMDEAAEAAFNHDLYRSIKGGQPFFMMESTPSIVNWRPVNKIPHPGTHTLTSIQAVAHGSDSVQYFQWRKARGGHEKFHGAVVDHCGHENTRVFREVTKLGKDLEKLSGVVDGRTDSKVAVIFDWENMWAIKYYNGYNNQHRDYVKESVKWYDSFRKRGIPVDVISMDDDFSKYDLIVAPFLYSFKDDTEDKIESYVKNGGNFAGTYLLGVTDKNDRCHLGGFPAGKLKDVFGIWAEETDSLPENMHNKAEYNGKEYSVDFVCDIIHAQGAEILGKYSSDFYAGMPAVTKNSYKNGTAYYIAFRNDADFALDFCDELIKDIGITSDSNIVTEENVFIRKRGDYIFVMNFSGKDTTVQLDKEYFDVLNGKKTDGSVALPVYGYMVLK